MKIKTILAVMTVFLLTACGTRAPYSPPQAFMYSDIKAPLSTEFNNTDLGNKKGEASTFSFLGLISVGDISLEAAARNGRITKVKHADYRHFNVLFFQKTTTIVYGD